MMNDQTAEEAYRVIEKIAKARQANGAFAYYSKADIYQEVWCMCLEAMDRYDPALGSMENYLNTHVANRMKNLKRDKYFRPGYDGPTSGQALVRMNLVNALPFGDGDIAEDGVLLCSTPINVESDSYMINDEIIEQIRANLPEHLISTFEALLGKNRIRSPLLNEIRTYILQILNRDNL